MHTVTVTTIAELRRTLRKNPPSTCLLIALEAVLAAIDMAPESAWVPELHVLSIGLFEIVSRIQRERLS